MSKELLDRLWSEYWAGKGYVAHPGGTFSTNENFPGLRELLESKPPGETFPMPPQWVLYYRRKGYRITGSFESFAVVSRE